MTRLAILMTLGSFALGAAACGKKSPAGGVPLAGPPRIEAASAASVLGSTDLPSVLADLAAARDKLLAAVQVDQPDAAKRMQGDSVVTQLMTAAGWESAGLDPKGEVAVVSDRRVALSSDDSPIPVPIVLLPVVDRAKFVAMLAREDVGMTLAAKVGSVEPLMRGSDTIGFMGTYGDRVALVLAPGLDATPVRAGFEAFLAGDGAPLADADSFRNATKDGPGGAGAYYWLSDLSQLEWIGQFTGLRRRDRERLFQTLPIQLQAVGLRVSRSGVSLRAVPQEASRAAFEALYRGNASPKDVGRVVPARGWAVGRVSLDLDRAMPALLAMFGQSESAVQLVLGQVGLSWDEIKDALSGEVGAAVDVQSMLATVRGDGMPSWIGILGVSDGARCDALVDKIVKLAVSDDRFGKREVTVNGQKAIVLERGAQAVVIARHDDLLLFTPSELSMAGALERADGESLSKTSAGEALRERLVLAAVLDLAPLVTWIDGQVRYLAGREGRIFAATVAADAFRADPVVTLRTGFDGDGHFSSLDDKGLVYSLAISGLVMSLIQESARKLERMDDGGGGGKLPHACEVYLETMSRCLEMLPTSEQRDAARDAMRAVGEAWRKEPSAAGLSEGCRQAYDAAKTGMAETCPKVQWPALE